MFDTCYFVNVQGIAVVSDFRHYRNCSRKTGVDFMSPVQQSWAVQSALRRAEQVHDQLEAAGLPNPHFCFVFFFFEEGAGASPHNTKWHFLHMSLVSVT